MRRKPAPLDLTNRAARWTALAVLMLPVLLVSVDNTVLSFALPQISSDLRPTGTQLLWVVDVYPLVLAGLLVPMGSLADRVGRRRLLLWGAGGFAAMSVVAAFAPTAAALVAARAGLGFFGAMLMPSTLSILRNVFTDRQERRLAVAVWAAGFAAGSAVGPIVGGLLLEHFWWGSVFLLTVPVLVVFLATAPRLVPESRDPAPVPVDLVSVGLVMATMAPLVLGIKAFARDGASPAAVLPVAIAMTAGTLFVRRQLRRPRPMLDVRLFAVPEFGGSVVINLLSVFSLVGFLLFVSQDLQLVVGLSPLEAGLVLLPGTVGMVVAGLAVVRVVRRVRPARVVAGALLLTTVAYAVTAVVAGASDVGPLLLAFVLLAVGVGAAETVSNDLVVSSVPPSRAGAASAISETAYEVGAVLGTAVLGSILTTAYHRGVEVPAGVPATDAAAASETLGGAVRVAGELPAAQGHALLESAHAAFASGVGTTSLIGAALTACAAVVALVALRRVRA
ncbi:MFS transporter [Isoptericola variabilis]|uniref:Major facilitator superfamily MFS_1 n=1 Tax=Isoptericola variabilis (strain 225) TaxID=743718 RepID=F6FPN4_ISOV2|nr:MFS transporter [Isoptericola variabilis]AEG44766.1 major facilitator superfamily MFS_1 [Isoptericola variabilis 225]TWH32379.1 DHA2 family multidrug resistance protein-like MFS transporter [Isoptericola variabilis J7]